jgi:hypothetical protein
VEVFVNAVDSADVALTNSDNRTLTAKVGDTVNLELSYTDLRNFDERLGLFDFGWDLSISDPNAIELLLIERQQISLGPELIFASSGFLTLAIEGSDQTEQIALIDLANDAEGSIQSAIASLTGININDVTVRSDPLFNSPNYVFDILYRDVARVNQDLPDVIATTNFDVEVNVVTSSEPVTNPDGSPNGRLLADTFDFRSRNVPNDMDPFGTSAYSFVRFADFDPAFGFRAIGATGPLVGSGIPGAYNVPVVRFDMLTIPFRVKKAVSFEISIAVSPERDILAYGTIANPISDRVVFGDESRITIDANLRPHPRFKTEAFLQRLFRRLRELTEPQQIRQLVRWWLLLRFDYPF